MALPQVPECSGTQDVLTLQHRGTGRTAVAYTARQVDMQAAILDCLAVYPWIEGAA